MAVKYTIKKCRIVVFAVKTTIFEWMLLLSISIFSINLIGGETHSWNININQYYVFKGNIKYKK